MNYLKKDAPKKLNNIAIIRVEQLYPFPEHDARAILAATRPQPMWCGVRKNRESGCMANDDASINKLAQHSNSAAALTLVASLLPHPQSASIPFMNCSKPH